MAATITVVCPECEKTMQAPAEFAGRKVRCKACSHVFEARPAAPPGAVARQPAKAGRGARPADRRAPAPAPPPPTAPVMPEDEDSLPYQVTDTSLLPRCPECANEMESEDAIICLHCGYNTVTRERLGLRKVEDVTGADRFLWLLPGILCAMLVLFLIVLDIVYCVSVEADRGSSLLVVLLAAKSVKMWFCIGTVFIMFFAAKFAYKRLLLHPNPPEVERH